MISYKGKLTECFIQSSQGGNFNPEERADLKKIADHMVTMDNLVRHEDPTTEELNEAEKQIRKCPYSERNSGSGIKFTIGKHVFYAHLNADYGYNIGVFK